MPERSVIDDFLAPRHLAFVGVSGETKQLANSVLAGIQPAPQTGHRARAVLRCRVNGRLAANRAPADTFPRPRP
jgi:hypothetical protein